MSRAPIALALVTVTLVACGVATTSPSPGLSGAGPSGSPPPGVTVVLVDGRFVPPGDTGDGVPALSIPPGTTVTFSNEGALRHTATHSEDGFPLPDALFDLDLEPGYALSYTFESPGSYQVTCVPHPEMVLTVVIE